MAQRFVYKIELAPRSARIPPFSSLRSLFNIFLRALDLENVSCPFVILCQSDRRPFFSRGPVAETAVDSEQLVEDRVGD